MNLALNDKKLELSSFADFWWSRKVNKIDILPLEQEQSALRYENLISHFYITIKSGKRIEVLTLGKGEVLLFISGLGVCAPIWYYQLSSLSKEYKTVVINMPGHGLSEITNDLSYEGCSLVLGEVLDALDISEPIHLIGACTGANFALALAAFKPKIIYSLILINSVYNFDTDLFKDTRLNKDHVKKVMSFLKLFDKKLSSDFSDSIQRLKLSNNADFSTQTVIYEKSKVIDPYAYMLYVTDISKNINPDSFIKKIQCPTLIMAGSHDSVINISDSEEICKKISGSKMLKLNHSGHFPYLLENNTFNCKLQSFLKEIR